MLPLVAAESTGTVPFAFAWLRGDYCGTAMTEAAWHNAAPKQRPKRRNLTPNGRNTSPSEDSGAGCPALTVTSDVGRNHAGKLLPV